MQIHVEKRTEQAGQVTCSLNRTEDLVAIRVDNPLQKLTPFMILGLVSHYGNLPGGLGTIVVMQTHVVNS